MSPNRFASAVAPAVVAALLALGAGGCFGKKPASVTVPLTFRQIGRASCRERV